MKKNNCILLGLVLFAGFSLLACSDDKDIIDDKIELIADDEPQPVTESSGFWVVNEDWFGHDNGTVNYFRQQASDSYEAMYRAYRVANGENEQLGVTTQFGTVWGENIYFISKQGNRLVVADAETLKKKAVLTEIGGDGRSFVGINENKGYVSHTSGIAVFDIKSFSITGQIEGASGQIGMMGLSGNHVFAVSQQNGIYVIDTETDQIVRTIAGTYSTLTISKEGDVWVAGSNGFLRIDPLSLDSEEIVYPEGAAVGSSWGAWNAGSLCASTQKNVLYWTAGGGIFGGGRKVLKYDINKATSSVIYELGQSEEGEQLAFYGAGLRVDPLTDNLILTVKHDGWGASGAYNWIYKLDNTGHEITHFALKGDNGSGASWAGNAEDWNEKYFWFPALPLFEDANKPQILLNQIMLSPDEEVKIDLSEKVVDYDNTLASIQYYIVAAENKLANISLDGHILKVVSFAQTGIYTCKIGVLSNGIRVEKEIEIVVIE